ncbi:MAG: zinc-dependent metalloprotease [Myxococcales bacterium]|nr:zinc-dependent metalloprotease [Myxococcales bacterium]
MVRSTEPLRRRVRSLVAVSLLVASGAGCPHASRPTKPPSAGSDLKRFSSLTAKSKERRGFFDTYQKGDDLFVAVPKARLGEKFLLSARIAQGVGAVPLLSGTSVDGSDGSIVSFERFGERLYLVQHPVRVVAAAGSASTVALQQSYSPSVVQSAAIESERPDGSPVINAKSWFVGDLSGVGGLVAALSRPGRGSSPGTATLNRERSFVESIKAFPDNLLVRTRLTYPMPDRAVVPSVPDDRYLSLSVTYSLSRLPTQPMPARRDDDRIGFFTTTHYDLDSASADPYVRVINRWRLTDGKPLTFYLDPSIPVAYHRFVEAGVLAWQAAFAAAGWPSALRVAPLPKGADPEDLRYPTIRWDASVEAPLGLGQRLVDPRSGEILGASILLGSHLLRHHRRVDLPLLGERVPVGAHAAMDPEFSALWDRILRRPLARPVQQMGASESLLDADGESFSTHMEQQSVLLRSALLASGAILASEPMPDRVLGQAIQFTTMHEVGHALGLRHNFKASAAIPNERLADMAWVREHGLLASIMDYPGLNLPRGHAPTDWAYYSPRLGDSDQLTIQYGYGRDAAQAKAVVRQAAQRGHLLGTDEDAHSQDGVDPAAQTWDLGADSLAWARERIEVIQALWQALPARVLVDNAAHGELTSVVLALLGEYGSAVDIALRFVGGQQIARDHVGDPSGRPPYRPVEKARQKEALDLLLRYAFAEGAMSLPSQVLSQLGPPPISGFVGRRLQFELPVLRLVRAFQQRMLHELLSKDALLRLRHSEYKFGPTQVLTQPELFEQLTQALWSEVFSSSQPQNITAARRDLQRVHIESMAQLLTRREDGSVADSDSRALARFQLSELRRRLQEREKSVASLDGYTRAHLADLATRIGKILDATLLEGPL